MWFSQASSLVSHVLSKQIPLVFFIKKRRIDTNMVLKLFFYNSCPHKVTLFERFPHKADVFMQQPHPGGLPNQGKQYAEPVPIGLGAGGRSGTLSIKQQNHKTGKTKGNQLDMREPGTWPSRQSIPISASRQNLHDSPQKPTTHPFLPDLPKSGNKSPRPPP